jgi:hypothetical protein
VRFPKRGRVPPGAATGDAVGPPPDGGGHGCADCTVSHAHPGSEPGARGGLANADQGLRNSECGRLYGLRWWRAASAIVPSKSSRRNPVAPYAFPFGGNNGLSPMAGGIPAVIATFSMVARAPASRSVVYLCGFLLGAVV